MDDGLAKIIEGLIVAALGGITFIAYRHPREYGKFSRFLLTILGAVLIGGLGWSAGVWIAASAAYKAANGFAELHRGRQEELMTAISATGPPGWIAISIGAAFTYLIFLETLPLWLLHEEPPKEKQK